MALLRMHLASIPYFQGCISFQCELFLSDEIADVLCFLCEILAATVYVSTGWHLVVASPSNANRPDGQEIVTFLLGRITNGCIVCAVHVSVLRVSMPSMRVQGRTRTDCLRCVCVCMLVRTRTCVSAILGLSRPGDGIQVWLNPLHVDVVVSFFSVPHCLSRFFHSTSCCQVSWTDTKSKVFPCENRLVSR